jgi:5-methylcytosine-specific restriction endonuclease McrA
MSRHEFTKRTRLEAFTRCEGKCEACGAILRPGHFEYDHDKPAEFSGAATLDNCRVLCLGCHKQKTAGRDIPAIAKSNRVRARQAEVKRKQGRPLAGTRASGLRKRMNGNVERWPP